MTRTKMINNENDRANSILEILRIIFLSFLIFTHFFPSGKFLDTTIIQHLSYISVNGFALITGMFVYRKKSLFFRNISRLMFIILFSMIIGFFISYSPRFSFWKHAKHIFSGSAHIWYIYAILPVYLVGPLIYRTIIRIDTKFILLMAAPFYLIGAMAQYKLHIGHTKIFWFSPIGIIFDSLFLFSLSLIGFAIKRHSQMTLRTKILIILLIFIPAEIIGNLLFFKTKWGKFAHGDIFLTISAASLLIVFADSKWYSRKVNWLSKRMYFVYEYQWYWIALWKILFISFIKSNPHLQYYVGYLFILTIASIISIITTEIQINVWNKLVDPVLLFPINWTKSKIINYKQNK